MNQTRISELPTLAQQLQTADYIPVVHSGDTYKYSLFDYMVKNSGNETIAGVKTFSSSPLVPTPTTDMQASTKKYVDDEITGLNVGLPSGIATLDSTGKVPSTQMPQLVITDVFVVATEAEMLALTTAEQGDIAKRTDYTPAKTFILSASPSSTLSNWVELTVSVDPNTPTSDQKAALAGNDGTPSASNPYATDSSLVPLEAFKLYNPDYPYALNEPCFYAGVPYKSLSADNAGHQPDTSPIYWEVTGGAGSATNVGFDVPNGQFEKGIVDWNLYADAAGIAPIDGTGGSATITIVHNTTNPLNGYGDLILTKPASNCQGNGLSTDIIIDDGQLTTPAEITLDYMVPAAYVAGYLKAYIYDVTNAIFCPCSAVDIPATFGSMSKLSTLFIPNNNSNNYRLCFHVADSSSTPWTFELDNVQVGNWKTFSAPAVTPWVDYPAGAYVFGTQSAVAFAAGKCPIGAVTTNPTKGTTSEDHAQWSRSGEDMLVRFDYKQTAAGSAGSGIYLLALPAGYTIDLTKNPVGSIIGNGKVSTSADEASNYTCTVVSRVYDNSNIQIDIVSVNASSDFMFQLGLNPTHTLSASSIFYRFSARFTCAQFSVNTVFNGINEPFYLSNSETTANTNGVVGKTKLGIDGSLILANTAATYFDCALPRALLPNETPQIQVRSKIDGQWIPLSDALYTASAGLYMSLCMSAVIPNGSAFAGIGLRKVGSGIIRVMFGVGSGWAASFIAWAAMLAADDGFDRWRIRIGQAGMSEVASGGSIRANASVNLAATALILSGSNIASITRTAVGCYTVAFTIPMPHANYTVQLTGSFVAGQEGCVYLVDTRVSKTINGFGIIVGTPGTAGSQAIIPNDSTNLTFITVIV